MQLILSLFPGIGLLDRAFEDVFGDEACIVRGPDKLWGGDIRTFHPPTGKFDGVIGGPPCQHWSRLRHIVEHRYGADKVAPDLIPEYERCIAEAQPQWFVMEEVEAAPVPTIPGYAVSSTLLNNRWFGGEQHRKRRISFGIPGNTPVDLWRHLELEPLERAEWAPAVLASGAPSDRGNRKPAYRKGRDNLRFMSRASHQSVANAIRMQGLPADFLADAPFTVEGKQKVIGNGVPLWLGRAIAKAVKEAIKEAAYEPAH